MRESIPSSSFDVTTQEQNIIWEKFREYFKFLRPYTHLYLFNAARCVNKITDEEYLNHKKVFDELINIMSFINLLNKNLGADPILKVIAPKINEDIKNWIQEEGKKFSEEETNKRIKIITDYFKNGKDVDGLPNKDYLYLHYGTTKKFYEKLTELLKNAVDEIEPEKKQNQNIKFQDINLGLINVWWDNGSFQVPDEAPNTSQFTKFTGYCVEWKSSLCGNLTVPGNFNYAVIDDKFYFMSKVSPINDKLDEWIYLLTFDIWLNYKQNLKITGDIIRTNDEKIIRENIHLIDPITTKYDDESYIKLNPIPIVSKRKPNFIELEEWPFFVDLYTYVISNSLNGSWKEYETIRYMSPGETKITCLNSQKYIYFGINYLVKNIYLMIEEVIKNKGYGNYFIKKYSGEKTIINAKINEDDYFIISTRAESPLGGEILDNCYLKKIDLKDFKNAALLDPDLSYTSQTWDYSITHNNFEPYYQKPDPHSGYYSPWLGPYIYAENGWGRWWSYAIKWNDDVGSGGDVGLTLAEKYNNYPHTNIYEFKNGKLLRKHLYELKKEENNKILENYFIGGFGKWQKTKSPPGQLYFDHNSPQTKKGSLYNVYWRTKWDKDNDYSLNYVDNEKILKFIGEETYTQEEQKIYDAAKKVVEDLATKEKDQTSQLIKLVAEIQGTPKLDKGIEDIKRKEHADLTTERNKTRELKTQAEEELKKVTKINPTLQMLDLVGGCIPVGVVSRDYISHWNEEPMDTFTVGIFCRYKNCNPLGGEYSYNFKREKMIWISDVWYFIPFKSVTLGKAVGTEQLKWCDYFAKDLGKSRYENPQLYFTYPTTKVLYKHLINSWRLDRINYYNSSYENSNNYLAIQIFQLEKKKLPKEKQAPHLRLDTGQYFDFSGLWSLEGTNYYIYYYLYKDQITNIENWEWDLIIPKYDHLGYIDLVNIEFTNVKFPHIQIGGNDN